MSKALVVNNNFNLIRLLAATQVLIVHACNHFGVDNVVIKALKIFPGVPIFFFISGYLIGGTYIKNHQKGLKVFFRNRILRLFPALIVCVIFSLLLVFATGYFKAVEFKASSFLLWVFGQISFYQFYNPEFMRSYGVGVLNGSLWTISVEIQFYLLTPLIYYLLKSKRTLVYIAVLIIVSVCLNVYLKFNSDWSKIYIKFLTVSFLPWVFMFITGFIFKYYDGFLSPLKRINILYVFILFVITMVTVGNYKFNAMNSINPLSALLLSVLVYIFSTKEIKIPLFLRTFINKNDISYGMYIYHMPIINTLLYLKSPFILLNILLTISLTILMSYLSWIFIENPFLNKKL